MAAFDAETPLARRFAAALAATLPGRVRIPCEAYLAAFITAEPSLATTPDRRARLAGAIEELVAGGVLVASRACERSEWPPLPRFVMLVDRVVDPPVAREAASYPWRPELAWAGRLPLRRSELAALQAIQAFLRDRGAAAAVVPIGERSLELFGDEKRLDLLRRNRRLFAPGRLSLALLGARVYAPPFAFRRVGDGPVALVLENVATYHSVLATLPSTSPVGLVVFGAGGNFAASVAFFAELADAGGAAASIREIRYFGDLDRRGLEIPRAANVTARASGLPAVRPAIALWATLLHGGRRAPHPAVDPAIAAHLVRWLPASLRDAARALLTSGVRLAQEAVGTERLAVGDGWATWAGLGPPGVERADDADQKRRRPSEVRRPSTAPDGDAALVRDDTGEVCDPVSEEEWDGWVVPEATRNWVLGDPLLDWLARHGRAAGFVPDDERAGYDPRTDWRLFLREKAAAFEAGVRRLLPARAPIVQIAERTKDARSLDKARETVAALRAGVPVVAGAVLRNPEQKVYGVADLLVRADVLATWFPELLSSEEAAVGAPALGGASWHYRPVGIRFRTFDLRADGHVATVPVQLVEAVQVWLCAQALGRVQRYTPPAAYLLGRTWREGDAWGEGCFERVARVEGDRWLRRKNLTLQECARCAVAWVHRLRRDGAAWHVFPAPSVPELYPYARNGEDRPWREARREIAIALRELTLLPGLTPERRDAAHAAGIRRWDQEDLSAERLGIAVPTQATRTNAVLAANRASAPTVVPARIQTARVWREVPPVELFVDFETVSDLDDDFTHLPEAGGRAQIVQIGCGQVAPDGAWRFAQWTVDALTLAEEGRILDAWLGHMSTICRAADVRVSDARLCHWSAAEPISLSAAYGESIALHPDAAWPPVLGWFDLLEQLVRAEPIAVTGAFSFGLKSIARAMQAAGFIGTIWDEGPTDGLGAMPGIWSAAREARAARIPLSTHPLMIAIGRYNEIDCRTMAEILVWLRANR